MSRSPRGAPRSRSKPGPQPQLGEAKTAAIAVRTAPRLKAAAERAAAADRRSLSAWIEGLIIAELERMKNR